MCREIKTSSARSGRDCCPPYALPPSLQAVGVKQWSLNNKSWSAYLPYLNPASRSKITPTWPPVCCCVLPRATLETDHALCLLRLLSWIMLAVSLGYENGAPFLTPLHGWDINRDSVIGGARQIMAPLSMLIQLCWTRLAGRQGCLLGNY